ncbi:MAG TPA: amidohydrolase family protein [Chloroflexota bacterium]|jgi:predicted TIM-barrel fold metal-dependent hydrolase
MERNYPIISADSHLQVAPERWTGRIPAQHRELAPRTVPMWEGAEGIAIGDGKPSICNGGLSGMPYEKRSPIVGIFEESPGLGSPQQRLHEQDIDGISGEVLFTFFAGADSYRSIKGEAYRATIHAWNEFLAEEYCPVSPNRLIGMGMIPTSNLADAMAELEYCKRMGLKGVALARYPSGQEFPMPEDDRFWTAALEMDMPLTCHVAFSGSREGHPPFTLQKDFKELSAGVDPFSKFAQYAVRGAGNAVQMIFDGLFDRFPSLKFYFAETMIGWLPHFLETLDDQYDRHIHWANRLLDVPKLDRMPSEYVREHFSWGFMHNPVGVRMRHEIGVSQIMWSTDFPHAESDWPESQKTIEINFAGVPEDEQKLLLSDNVRKFFHLENAVYEPSRIDSSSAVASSASR